LSTTVTAASKPDERVRKVKIKITIKIKIKIKIIEIA
jgi:hypothetical protein